MELQLKNTKGDSLGTIEVRDDVFDVPMNVALVHQVMVSQLANRRQGTAKTKTRAQVSGGGIKPRPQKGTGRARQGSIRSPQWRGGGIVFGPIPRSYNQRTPKRMKRRALLSVLSDKARQGQIIVLEKLELEQPKTKEMARVLGALGVDRGILLVADGASAETLRSARNIPKLKTSPASLMNAVDLINARIIIMTVDAVRKAEALWGGPFVRRKVSAVATAVGE